MANSGAIAASHTAVAIKGCCDAAMASFVPFMVTQDTIGSCLQCQHNTAQLGAQGNHQPQQQQGGVRV